MTLMNPGPLKVLIVAPLSRYSGYGSDGLDMAEALARKGVDVYLQPINLQPPVSQIIAGLLMKNLEAPFDIIIHHTDPGVLKATPEQQRASDVLIGWSMWEYTTLDCLHGKSTFKSRMANFDGLYGYSDVTVGAFKKAIPRGLPMSVLQGGYNPTMWQYMERDWNSPRFSFIMNGQLGPRKGVHAAILAFSELKDEYPVEFEPAEMHLHNTLSNLPPMLEDVVPKLRIHYRTFDDYEMHEFYRSGHVLLAPSRGEGKNLPALEMLSTGGGVIATDWSGHQQWLNSDYAYSLDYELVPMGIPKHFDCMWAEPDKDHLKRLMLHCFRNREEVRKKGIIGSEVIPQMCSWDKVMDDFFHRLPELLPDKGTKVMQKFDEAVENHKSLVDEGAYA